MLFEGLHTQQIYAWRINNASPLRMFHVAFKAVDFVLVT